MKDRQERPEQESRGSVSEGGQRRTRSAEPRSTIDDFGAGLAMDAASRARLDTAVQLIRGAAEQREAGVHEAAERGTRGAAGRLPHLPTIQASFGGHDVSNVQAHVGGAAREASESMGAEAFATGNKVAFRSNPDLWTTAHEATHVIQQRRGVQLSGGVGKSGDAYERHADAVADAVVAGRSAEPMLASVRAGGTPDSPVQLSGASSTEGNVMSPGWDQETFVRRVQERLVYLRILEEGSFRPGRMDAATRTAVQTFQEQNLQEIERIRGASQRIRGSWNNETDAGESALLRGRIQQNDATTQALANAWPRDFFGVRVYTEAQGYAYLVSEVGRLGLTLDTSRVNIVGIRGFQGGQTHDADRSYRHNNVYDDCFVVLALDAQEQPHMREFKGTTDPGGDSDAARRDDPLAARMTSGQQLEYEYDDDVRYKGGQPTLEPRGERVRQVGGAPEPAAPAEDASGETGEPGSEAPATRTEEPRPAEPPAAATEGDDSAPAAAGGPPRATARRGIHVVYGNGGETRQTGGIAMHSGGAGETVQAYSTGCQVVHGSWYGNYIDTIRRALTWQLQRAGLPVPQNADGLVMEGRVVYSLIEGSELQPPEQQQPPEPAPEEEQAAEAAAGEEEAAAGEPSGEAGAAPAGPAPEAEPEQPIDREIRHMDPDRPAPRAAGRSYQGTIPSTGHIQHLVQMEQGTPREPAEAPGQAPTEEPAEVATNTPATPFAWHQVTAAELQDPAVAQQLRQARATVRANLASVDTSRMARVQRGDHAPGMQTRARNSAALRAHLRWTREQAANPIFQEVLADPELSRFARLVPAFLALSRDEGGTSGINTYDGQALTVGAGFAMSAGQAQAWIERLPSGMHEQMAAHGMRVEGGTFYLLTLEGDQPVLRDAAAWAAIRLDASRLAWLSTMCESEEQHQDDQGRTHQAREWALREQFRQFAQNNSEIPDSILQWPAGALGFTLMLRHWYPSYHDWGDIEGMSGTNADDLATSALIPFMRRANEARRAVIRSRIEEMAQRRVNVTLDMAKVNGALQEFDEE